MNFRRFWMRQIPLTGLLVMSSLLATGIAGFLTETASAHVGPCRSDPVFTLSTGQTLTLVETITDSTADITGGSYVVHIPAGTSVTNISWSGTVGSQQSVKWYADQSSGHYRTTSTVLTKTGGISVTAYMTVASNKKMITSTSATGMSNTPIANSV